MACATANEAAKYTERKNQQNIYSHAYSEALRAKVRGVNIKILPFLLMKPIKIVRI